ncbi:MAG: hypothetical protein V8S92_06930 [Oscillospiraceae bacterium]
MDKLMNLSFCFGEVTVVSDFSDLALIGKRHYLTLHGACTSEELEKVDGKETALRLITGQTGCVTQYGVIYDNGMKLEKVYDQRHLPPIWMSEHCLLELEIGALGEMIQKSMSGCSFPRAEASWNARCFVPGFHPAARCRCWFQTADFRMRSTAHWMLNTNRSLN